MPYAILADCTDPVVTVEQGDLNRADIMVAAVLRNKGIDPADVTAASGLALLKELAVAEATANAAKRGAVEGDSPLWKKYEVYTRVTMELIQRIDRESLGIEDVGSGAVGFGSLRVGRG